MDVLVHLRARSDQVEAAERILGRIAEPTQQNSDCLEFRILHSTDDLIRFYLLERWTSAQANLDHAQREYMAEFMETKDQIFDLVDGEFVDELRRRE